MLEAEYYGWPIAQALEDSGIGISGCDISKRLVDEAKKTLKTNDIYVGDLNNINLTDKYDVVYCLRTSWCMPNFEQCLEKMMKIAKEDGYLIFDIMDRKSGYFAKYVCRYLRHAAKKVIGLESTHSKLYFYSGRKLERLLAREHVAFKRYHENQITKSTDRFNTPKRIYICRRQS